MKTILEGYDESKKDFEGIHLEKNNDELLIEYSKHNKLYIVLTINNQKITVSKAELTKALIPF